MGFFGKLKRVIMGGAEKAEKAGKDVEHGAEKAGKDVEHGAEKAGKAVDDSEEKT
jgi:hypothetical protein